MTQDLPYCCVCGGNEAAVFWPAKLPPRIESVEFSYTGNKTYHGQIVRCLGCGHLYVYPRPADALMMYRQVVDGYYLKTEKERQRTFEEFLDLKERFCPDRGDLLDVGCNTGIFLNIASLRGYNAEGIELSNWAVDIAQRRGLKVRNALLNDLAGEHRSYDTITAFDVIEHLADPFEALTVIRSLLREGGCFVATVPDMDAWHAKLLGPHHWLVVIMHFQYFTRQAFSRLVKRAGFSKFKIVSAPAYRIRLMDAAENIEYNWFLKSCFFLLSRVPIIKNMEIRLKASLFCVAWK